MKNPLIRLSEWYKSQCDGKWEHQYGIKVITLDNPGFMVTIDLDETPLEKVDFVLIEEDYEDPEKWLRCWKDGSKFNAAGAPMMLSPMIECFLYWVDQSATKTKPVA